MTATPLMPVDGVGPAKYILILQPFLIVRVTYAAFSTLVAESEKQARSRGHMSEKMEEELAKTIKEFNKDKAATSKRVCFLIEITKD